MDLFKDLEQLVFKKPVMLFMENSHGQPINRTVYNMDQLSSLLIEVNSGIVRSRPGALTIEQQLWYYLAVGSNFARIILNSGDQQ